MLAQQPDLRATHEKRLSPHQYYPALVDRVFYVDDPATTGLGAAAVDQVHAGFDAWKSMAS